MQATFEKFFGRVSGRGRKEKRAVAECKPAVSISQCMCKHCARLWSPVKAPQRSQSPSKTSAPKSAPVRRFDAFVKRSASSAGELPLTRESSSKSTTASHTRVRISVAVRIDSVATEACNFALTPPSKQGLAQGRRPDRHDATDEFQMCPTTKARSVRSSPDTVNDSAKTNVLEELNSCMEMSTLARVCTMYNSKQVGWSRQMMIRKWMHLKTFRNMSSSSKASHVDSTSMSSHESLPCISVNMCRVQIAWRMPRMTTDSQPSALETRTPCRSPLCPCHNPSCAGLKCAMRTGT